MKQAVAHACIVCDYHWLWDALCPDPHPVLYCEAKQSSRSYYAEDMEARAEKLGVNLRREPTRSERIQMRATVADKEPTTTFLHGLASTGLVDTDEGQDYTQ